MLVHLLFFLFNVLLTQVHLMMTQCTICGVMRHPHRTTLVGHVYHSNIALTWYIKNNFIVHLFI